APFLDGEESCRSACSTGTRSSPSQGHDRSGQRCPLTALELRGPPLVPGRNRPPCSPVPPRRRRPRWPPRARLERVWTTETAGTHGGGRRQRVVQQKIAIAPAVLRPCIDQEYVALTQSAVGRSHDDAGVTASSGADRRVRHLVGATEQKIGGELATDRLFGIA